MPALSGEAAGRARAAAGRRSTDMTVTVIDDSGQPVSGAQVVTVARNGTYVDATAEADGIATLRLPARQRVTLYAAHSTSVPALVLDHDPSLDLDVTLPHAVDGGNLIFKAGTGHIPGLSGRLNPIRDRGGETDRYYLYADNISINDQPDQPYPFTPGQPLRLEDAQGNRAVVTIVSLIGRSSLVRFEQ